MTYYVYSTATCGCDYVQYEDNSSKDLGVVKRRADGSPFRVTINGGHGVSDKHFVTPRGVVTSVSDEDMDFLLQNHAFLRHVKAGFLAYDKKEVKTEKKVQDMNQKDGSSPITPADFEKGENSSADTPVYKKKGAPTL